MGALPVKVQESPRGVSHGGPRGTRARLPHLGLLESREGPLLQELPCLGTWQEAGSSEAPCVASFLARQDLQQPCHEGLPPFLLCR